MNRNLVTDLDWDDPHAYTLNRLHSLYQVETSGLGNLTDLGYRGFADPLFKEGDERSFTPDYLAIGSDGDAQIIDVKGFDNIEEFLNGRADVEDKISEVIGNLDKYWNVTPSMVADYLSLWDISFEPNHHELIVLIPYKVFERYETAIIDAAESAQLEVWVLGENSIEHLWLVYGEHDNSELNVQLDQSSGQGARVYQGGKDFIRFVRDTNRDIVRFFFVANLTSYCAHEGKLTFTFEEIDDILVRDRKPPMFGHLPPSEREDIWIDCIRAMRDRFNLISRLPTVEDTYEWERTRFLKHPPDRFQIMQNIGDDLGILEEVS